MGSGFVPKSPRPKVTASAAQGCQGVQGELPPFEKLQVNVPEIPGDVGLCGHMAADMCAVLAMRCKSWVYMNKEDNPLFERQAIADTGCQVEVVYFPEEPSDEEAANIVDALDRLPRPLMLQCDTGYRSSGALLYWLALRRGYTADSVAQLGQDGMMKCYTDMMKSGLRDFLAAKLPKMTAVGQGVDGLIFQQLFDEPTSTLTYVLGCAETKEAILLDPVLEQKDRDLAAVRELGLTLKYVVNTHCHADHVTSGGMIRKELPDVKTVIAKASGAMADIHLVEGDTVTFGKLSLQTLATPGHTDGCMTYYLPGTPGLLFTGDTLLIRGCGRTDFQQGDSALMYDNVHGKIFVKPDDTLIYPGHDYKGRNVSTVAEERRFNPRLTKPKEEFVKLMSELNLPYPKRIDVALPANLVCGVQD